MLAQVIASTVRAGGDEKCLWNCTPKSEVGAEPLLYWLHIDEVQLSDVELWTRESQLCYGLNVTSFCYSYGDFLNFHELMLLC